MWWLLVPLAYLVGSIQWGLIIVALSRHMDVRSLGSGKTGVTNVLRTAGKRAAVLVLLLDAGKGLALVLAARALTDDSAVHAATAAAVIIGHVWPAFAGFRGGRGIATGAGTALGLFPLAGLAGIAAFVPIVAMTRYVSLGSVVSVVTVAAAFAAATAMGYVPPAYLAFALACSALIVWMHRDNIRRLLQGTERRLGERVASP
ncbi:MAG: glycerol-3-phosphate 1-O-acyltransferase PlsY [Dehalococcoidia bacterium]